MGFTLDPLLLTITFVLLVIIFPALCFFAYLQRHSVVQERKAVSGYSNYVSDMVEGLREIQQTKTTQLQLERGFGDIEKILKSELSLFLKLGSLKPGIRLAYVFLSFAGARSNVGDTLVPKSTAPAPIKPLFKLSLRFMKNKYHLHFNKL